MNRLRNWIDDLRSGLAHKLIGMGPGWRLVPIHDSEWPGSWVACKNEEYTLLLPYGYPYPKGHETEVEDA
jgi:hypothetical protein